MSCVHPTQPYPFLPSIPFPSDIARETLNSERPRTRLTHFRIAHSICRTVSTVPGYDSRSSLRREYPPLLSILYSVRYSFFALFRTHTPSIYHYLPSFVPSPGDPGVYGDLGCHASLTQPLKLNLLSLSFIWFYLCLFALVTTWRVCGADIYTSFFGFWFFPLRHTRYCQCGVRHSGSTLNYRFSALKSLRRYSILNLQR